MALALPLTYLLPTHLSAEMLRDLEDQIPTLTSDITEAKLVLGKVTSKQRALFELRTRKLYTEEVASVKNKDSDEEVHDENVKYDGPAHKRRKIDSTDGKAITILDNAEPAVETDSEMEYATADEYLTSTESRDGTQSPAPMLSRPIGLESRSSIAASFDCQPDIDWEYSVKVVKLAWFTECLEVGHLQPLGEYLIYEGIPVERVKAPSPGTKAHYIGQIPKQILSRARDDSPTRAPFIPRGFSGIRRDRTRQSSAPFTRPTHLVRQTTSEYDNPENLPPIPDFLHTTYSCQRPTPMHSPNDLFIDQLKKIRTARVLEADEVGVRAYSTAIAALAAYPYSLTSAQEVTRLPGCDQKITFLYQEWKDRGRIAVVDDIASEPRMQALNLFYEIWGVGAHTAREFYNKGWRELDDIVEYGWSSLTRVQQIGVKYYDEFHVKIPRAEVEAISDTIFFYANRIHAGFHMCIVGGHRRGKAESGDVDVVLSHPNESYTFGFIQDLVGELEKTDWITHTLLLSTANSERGQTPVSWKGESGRRSSGFDTLDKALLVWQDPNWPTKEEDLKKNPKTKNPNIHRRVDIIISPWKTAGCAVAGWTSGTTFQRDLRRYVRKTKNLKFDSSGIRSRVDGRWLDLESVGGKAPDLLTAEMRVFEGLGLEWREPNERCTG